MKIRYLSLLSLFLAAQAFAENDLSPFTKAQLAAEVFQFTEEGTTGVEVKVPHDYTNTLSCDITMPLRLVSTSSRAATTRTMTFQKVMVFPREAFGSDLTYPVSVTLPAGQKLEESFSGKGTAICSGWDVTRTSLPDDMCRTFDPGHDETCAMLAGEKGRYPLIMNGQYLGPCDCN